jgi:hypothetical protein
MVGCLTQKGATTMVQSLKSNGNAESKLNQDGSLQDHELDRVSGGFTPRDSFENGHFDKPNPKLQPPDGVPSGRWF